MRRLVANKVKCLFCGEMLQSFHRHDYKTCSCENETMVDGGLDYQRMGGKNMAFVESYAVYSDAPFSEIRGNMCRGGRGKDGKQPLTYVALKDVDDEWLAAIIAYEEEHRPENFYLPIYKKEQQWRTL